MKFFLWIKKFGLWILGGISSLMLFVALFFLRSRNKQAVKYETEKRKAELAKRQLDTATELGEVAGKDAVLAEQEKAVENSLNVITENIHASKIKNRSASEVADSLNSTYGRKSDG